MLWLKVYLDEVGERQRIDVTKNISAASPSL